jgi:hypothetical protein
VLQTVVTNLVLNQDYTFYLTGLNPIEGEPSIPVVFRAAGKPSKVGAIIEIPNSRIGTRLGL